VAPKLNTTATTASESPLSSEMASSVVSESVDPVSDPRRYAPNASAVKIVAASAMIARMFAHSSGSRGSSSVLPRWNRVDSRALKIAPRLPPMSTIVGTITASTPYSSRNARAPSSLMPATRTTIESPINSGNMFPTIVRQFQLLREPLGATTSRAPPRGRPRAAGTACRRCHRQS